MTNHCAAHVVVCSYLLQAKEGGMLGHCNRQHAASKQCEAGLRAEQLDKPQDASASDQVGQREF